jgi:peptide chain release factor 1
MCAPRASIVFSLTLLEEREGFLSFQIEGEVADQVFRNESGGHRWQRVPPTEKRGRVHTSTITVAVLPVPTQEEFLLPPDDLLMTTTRGSGPGGQNRNKVETEVILLHKPTRIQVRCGSERSQHQNRQLALALLAARLADIQRRQERERSNGLRRQQVGSGQRGDKIRTIRIQDNQVRCERTGKSLPYTRYSKGHIEFE